MSNVEEKDYTPVFEWADTLLKKACKGNDIDTNQLVFEDFRASITRHYDSNWKLRRVSIFYSDGECYCFFRNGCAQ